MPAARHHDHHAGFQIVCEFQCAEYGVDTGAAEVVAGADQIDVEEPRIGGGDRQPPGGRQAAQLVPLELAEPGPHDVNVAGGR